MDLRPNSACIVDELHEAAIRAAAFHLQPHRSKVGYEFRTISATDVREVTPECTR